MPSSFLIACTSAAESRDGFVYRALGMWKELPASPKGRRPPRWSLTHLGSGHQVCRVHAHMRPAFEIATKFAELGDWDFDGFSGWVNRDPELKTRFTALLLSFGKRCTRQPLTAAHNDYEVARQIAEARA